MTEDQDKLLSITEKLAKMQGVFSGWFYASMMAGNKDAERIAFQFQRDASIALKLILELNADVFSPSDQ